MPGSRKHHTDKFRSCVEKVMADGKSEDSAYAICTAQFQKGDEPIFEAAEARHLHLRGATGKVRIEMHDGREHIVVPVVALMEGVIHAVNAETPEFVPAHVLARAAASWNGRPVVLGHPVKNGRQCSANAPDVLASHGIGTIFNSRMEGKKLLQEAWIDKAKAERLHKAMHDRLLEGRSEEVSVGAFVLTDATDGAHNGRRYKGAWVETLGDHLAFLPGGRGACSIEMGCGAHRAASHLVTAEAMEPEVSQRVLDFFRSLMPRGWGDDEVKQDLRDALDLVEPALYQSGGEILRVKSDSVIYVLYPSPNHYDAPMGPSARMTYWQRGYSFDTATKKFTISPERKQVTPTTVYEVLKGGPVYKDCETCQGTGSKDGNPCEACEGTGELKTAELRAACGCDNKTEAEMTKVERIAALLKNEHNPIKDQKTLEMVSDDVLTVLEAQAKTNADTKEAFAAKEAEIKVAKDKAVEAEAALKAASAKPQTEEEFLKVAPESIRTLVAEKKAADAALKSALVGQLKAAQSVYTEAELNEKPIDELRKLAQVARVDVPADYSGRGVPVARQAEEKLDSFEPPDPYAEGLKTLKASETAVN